MEFLDLLKTQYECIKNFSKAFGVKEYSIFSTQTLEDTDNLKLRLDLIEEEIKELGQAIKTNDLIEIRDAIADILYVVIGMPVSLAIDIVSKYEESCKNNLFETKEYDDLFSINFDKFDLDIFRNKEYINKHYTYLYNSFKSLEKFTNQKNSNSIVNYLSHLLYITYSIGKCYSINVRNDFDIVHKSNMSKICSSEDEAKRTIEKYKNDKKYPNTYYIKNDYGYVVRNKSNNKVLKNINYTPAKFE